ncbi:hypothetical protein [Microbacterium sp.]|uniref:hypothetical protein n=1 Tax=Microbacterium sp. TaxID=51671 RepID=UPI002FE1D134
MRVRDGAAGEDVFGESIPGAPVETPLPPALFAPTPTALLAHAGVASTSTQPTVYWPREWPDVQAGDRLVVAGEEWTVDGRPASWPLGLVVELTGVKGVSRVG